LKQKGSEGREYYDGMERPAVEEKREKYKGERGGEAFV